MQHCVDPSGRRAFFIQQHRPKIRTPMTSARIRYVAHLIPHRSNQKSPIYPTPNSHLTRHGSKVGPCLRSLSINATSASCRSERLLCCRLPADDIVHRDAIKTIVRAGVAASHHHLIFVSLFHFGSNVDRLENTLHRSLATGGCELGSAHGHSLKRQSLSKRSC
jgi:hypothetical protein